MKLLFALAIVALSIACGPGDKETGRSSKIYASDQSLGGQDLGGGNENELEFIDIARTLAHSLNDSGASDDELGFDLQSLTKAIEDTEIEASGKTRKLGGMDINLNEAEWDNLTDEEKNILVLRSYLVSSRQATSLTSEELAQNALQVISRTSK